MIFNDKNAAHRKHAALARPVVGQFGKNEFAFVGTACGSINRLCGQLIKALAPRWAVAFADATHPKNDQPEPLPAQLENGAVVEFLDQTTHRQFLLKNAVSAFQNRPFFNETNLIFINGNHFEGKKQVVFIDSKKEASLQKRLAQLTNVAAFILADGQTEPFDWLKNTLPDWKNIPIFQQNDLAGLINFFEKEAEKTVAPLFGLVLAGGKSQRMGSDKGQIEWHDGQPQREFLTDLLTPFCEKVFLSTRQNQPLELQIDRPTLPDSFVELGPFGAILSAFREKPEAAWLVVACDLPLLDHPTLEFLVKNRRPDRLATAFQNPSSQMPEPLVTIWEPMSYAVLLSFLGQGYSCPRKVLMNSNIELLAAPDAAVLTNVNTPDELEKLKKEVVF